jgi:hypothetical protein
VRPAALRQTPLDMTKNLDTQWLASHLQQFDGIEISRNHFSASFAQDRRIAQENSNRHRGSSAYSYFVILSGAQRSRRTSFS